MPRLTVNATIYAEAALGIYDLAVMLASLPISHLSLSDLYEFEAVQLNGIRPWGWKTRLALRPRCR